MSAFILVVDDDPALVRALTRILAAEDHRTVSVGSGEAAVSRLASDPNFEVVLLDMVMPGGMTGLETLKTLRDQGMDLPVIMMSGAGTIATAVAAIKLGATDFIEKPIQPERILLSVRNAVQVLRLTNANAHLEDLVQEQTEELAAALAENEALIRHATGGLVGMDGAGVLRSANPVARDLLGLPDAPVGMGCQDVLPQEVVDLGMRCRATGTPDSIDIMDSQGRMVRVSANPVQSEDLDLGCVILVQDVTLEKEIDRMKTDFTATVSHELRTPLTSVLGFAKLIRHKLERRVFPHVDDDEGARRAMEQTRQNLDVIVQEGERLTSLINDLLDIAKMESGHMEWETEEVSPIQVVEQAVAATSALFPKDRPVQMEVQVTPDLPVIKADRDRLVQVMINLISNASKFTDQGRVLVTVGSDEKAVEFAVCDTGIGIPSAKIATVFEKFEQAYHDKERPQGTGLGLPICRQIVEAHRGCIWAESSIAGSRFAFTVPVP